MTAKRLERLYVNPQTLVGVFSKKKKKKTEKQGLLKSCYPNSHVHPICLSIDLDFSISYFLLWRIEARMPWTAVQLVTARLEAPESHYYNMGKSKNY